MVYTDGNVLVSDEGINLGSTNDAVLGNILRKVDIIALWLDFGTELGSLDGYFDGSNVGTFDGLFIGYLLGSTDGKVIGSGEGITFGSTYGKVLVPIVVYVEGKTLGLDVGTDLGSLV